MNLFKNSQKSLAIFCVVGHFEGLEARTSFNSEKSYVRFILLLLFFCVPREKSAIWTFFWERGSATQKLWKHRHSCRQMANASLRCLCDHCDRNYRSKNMYIHQARRREKENGFTFFSSIHCPWKFFCSVSSETMDPSIWSASCRLKLIIYSTPVNVL